jgi:hypothetical protein
MSIKTNIEIKYQPSLHEIGVRLLGHAAMGELALVPVQE